MGRIVAIGGGELDTTHRINEYIVKLASKKNPNFLFIGTASHDAEGYITGIKNEFESLGCTVSVLRLTTETYTDEEINSILNMADIIYVGGGDTSFMMDIWKKYGLDEKLKKIYYNDDSCNIRTRFLNYPDTHSSIIRTRVLETYGQPFL